MVGQLPCSAGSSQQNSRDGANWVQGCQGNKAHTSGCVQGPLPTPPPRLPKSTPGNAQPSGPDPWGWAACSGLGPSTGWLPPQPAPPAPRRLVEGPSDGMDRQLRPEHTWYSWWGCGGERSWVMPGGLPSLVHSAGPGAARKGGASCLSRVLTGEKPQRPAGSSDSEKPQGALVGGVRRPGPQATPTRPASPTTRRRRLPAG